MDLVDTMFTRMLLFPQYFSLKYNIYEQLLVNATSHFT